MGLLERISVATLPRHCPNHAAVTTRGYYHHIGTKIADCSQDFVGYVA